MQTLLQGIPASSGIAIGPAFIFVPADLTIPARSSDIPEREFALFLEACQIARLELGTIRDTLLRRTGSAEQAAIFDAHAVMLDDPMLAEAVRERIEKGHTVEVAVREATQELSNMLAAMQDELFAGRAVDVRDVGARLLRILLGKPAADLSGMQTPSIVIAQDLTPSDTANLDPKITLGLCTVMGGLTSHTAILARTLGIPAIVAMGENLLANVSSGTTLVLDGIEGTLTINPDAGTQGSYRSKKISQEHALKEAQILAIAPCHTADGRHVEVVANVGEVETARDAIEFGAEGVGLLRTEFLYLNDSHPPSEEKQVEIYRKILEAFGDKPVIIRTLDIGGDKPPSYLEFELELNPFLGWRAIRISLDDQPLFKTQLRSILRAAVGHNALIMFPMISGVEELRLAKVVLEEARTELKLEGLACPESIPVGIMVETPAAVALADALAAECDFLSLGTNDLTQYTLAVDRGNPKVAKLFQPLHPAVLRLINQTIQSGHSQGKWVGMCGELAGMEKAIPILLGMGLDEFSMVGRSIPRAKALIGKLTDGRAREIAAQALSLVTTAEVESMMDQVLASLQ